MNKPEAPFHDPRDDAILALAERVGARVRAAREARGLVTRATVNANNRTYAALYQALRAYLDALAPGLFGPTGTYHACIVSKNSQCVWHCDKSNIGHAALTALGEFEGGELLIMGA